MKKNNNTLDTSKWGAADYIAGSHRLADEIRQLEAMLATSVPSDKIPARPALKGGGANGITDFAILADHAAKLRQLVNVSGESVIVPPTAANPGAVATPAQKPAAKAWDPDAVLAAHKAGHQHADDDDKPSDEKAGNCSECSGTGRCPDCNGSGKPPGKTSDCSRCDGDGRCPGCNGNGSTKEDEDSGNNGKAKVFNPDAAILAARGVKTLAELNALPPATLGD